MKVEITESRLRALEAAEAFCQAARLDVVEFGGFSTRSYPWFERWMRLSHKRYEKPKPVRPIWCCECKGWHIAGRHLKSFP